MLNTLDPLQFILVMFTLSATPHYSASHITCIMKRLKIHTNCHKHKCIQALILLPYIIASADDLEKMKENEKLKLVCRKNLYTKRNYFLFATLKTDQKPRQLLNSKFFIFFAFILVDFAFEFCRFSIYLFFAGVPPVLS